MRSEQNTITIRGLAPIVLTIGGTISSGGWISIIVTLKEILEIFNRVIVKVSLAVMKILMNVFFGEQVEENDFCFCVIKFFFVTTIQQFDCMQRFLEAGVK